MVRADLAAISAIEAENPSPWSTASLAEELATPQAMQLVAETADARLLGWCACRMIWPEAELLKIAVTRPFRSRGIGGRLLEHVCGELQRRKAADMFLEVRSGNSKALRFYEKHGFFQVGVRPGYYTDPPDNAMLLRKNLSSQTKQVNNNIEVAK